MWGAAAAVTIAATLGLDEQLSGEGLELVLDA